MLIYPLVFQRVQGDLFYEDLTVSVLEIRGEDTFSHIVDDFLLAFVGIVSHVR